MTLDLGFELLAQLGSGELTELKSIEGDESNEGKIKKAKETSLLVFANCSFGVAANSAHNFRNAFHLQNDLVRSDCFASLPERPPRA